MVLVSTHLLAGRAAAAADMAAIVAAEAEEAVEALTGTAWEYEWEWAPEPEGEGAAPAATLARSLRLSCRLSSFWSAVFLSCRVGWLVVGGWMVGLFVHKSNRCAGWCGLGGRRRRQQQPRVRGPKPATPTPHTNTTSHPPLGSGI